MMNDEILLLFNKHTDALIEETKSRPQETLEIKLNKQIETFSFNPLINLFEEGKWLLRVTFFKTTNSVFNITDGNNSFSISTPGQPRIPNYLPEETIDKLLDLLKLRSEKDIEKHVSELKKKGNQILKEDKE